MNTAASALAGYGDGDLIARVIHGDEDLFEQLVHRYHRPVANFICRMVGDYEAALDPTQEVFLKIYRALDQYDERYRFSTWLFRIASNHAIDYLRKRNASLYSLDEPHDALRLNHLEIVSNEPSPEVQTIRSQQRTIIESVIAALPVPYRQVIILRHVAELGYEEIAEVTGLPLGTVKTRIFRAREVMRHKLIRLGINGSQ